MEKGGVDKFKGKSLDEINNNLEKKLFSNEKNNQNESDSGDATNESFVLINNEVPSTSVEATKTLFRFQK